MAETVCCFMHPQCCPFVVALQSYRIFQLVKEQKIEINKLEDRLRHIKEFVEAREGDKSRPDCWIANIRKVAFDVEDLIELYHLRTEERNKLSFSALFLKLPFGFLSLKSNKILDYIINFDDSIEHHRGVAAANDHIPVRECTPCGKEKFVVGLEEDTKKLVTELTRGEKNTSLHTVSIVGMGGIGKTTLAGEVYNDPSIVAYFDCRLWISVTQHFDYHDFLIAILLMNLTGTQLNVPLREMQVSELEKMLHKFLRGKKFLAVLDDVWNQDECNKAKSAFPDDEDSRLIVTTRNHDLQTGTPGYCHLMEALNEQDSRKLFLKKACTEAAVNTEFEDIRKKILIRCAGLPLAIIVVGRGLKKESMIEKWEQVYHELSNLQGPLVQDITNVLSLSVQKLSSTERSCFLRIGFFPENEEISSKSLIYLWAAEGLLSNSEHDDRGAQTNGKIKLKTLIKWSLIQAEAVSIDGTVKRCKIHPLMHVLAASKAREELYFQSETSSEIRHGAIFASCTSCTPFVKAPHLRSLLNFQLRGNILSSKQLKSIARYSKLLKVLYLKDMNIKKLPNAIGYIWNLRYLNLCNTGIKSLPSSVGYLVRLLILDVRKNPGLKGISIVNRLKSLRILHLDDSLKPFRIGSLEHLCTLGWVHSQRLKRNDISHMVNLEALKVIISDSSGFEELLKTLFELNNLVRLKLRMEHHLSSLLSLASRFCNMPNLKRLHLKIRMSELERRSNITRCFYVPMEELRTLSGLSISTLHSRCVQINELAIPGGGCQPYVYIKDISSI